VAKVLVDHVDLHYQVLADEIHDRSVLLRDTVMNATLCEVTAPAREQALEGIRLSYAGPRVFSRCSKKDGPASEK
jgi:hypothetical protein